MIVDGRFKDAIFFSPEPIVSVDGRRLVLGERIADSMTGREVIVMPEFVEFYLNPINSFNIVRQKIHHHKKWEQFLVIIMMAGADEYAVHVGQMLDIIYPLTDSRRLSRHCLIRLETPREVGRYVQEFLMTGQIKGHWPHPTYPESKDIHPEARII